MHDTEAMWIVERPNYPNLKLEIQISFEMEWPHALFETCNKNMSVLKDNWHLKECFNCSTYLVVLSYTSTIVDALKAQFSHNIVKFRYAQANMIYVKKQNHNKLFSLPLREKNANMKLN
jgi:hypothetical protein